MYVSNEGNWLGTKIDCIAVLFVCVGFLFGKLIFFNYTRFCFVFVVPPLYIPK